MNTGGWIMMGLAVGGVVCFFSWCMFKVITTRESTEHIHSPADIDPHDREPD